MSSVMRMLSNALLLAALCGLCLLGCGDDPAPDDAGSGEGSAVAEGSDKPRDLSIRPKKEYLQVTYEVEMVCRVNCPKRVRHAIGTLRWAGRVKPNFLAKQVTFRGEKKKIDLAAVEKRLRAMGYRPKLKNGDDLPAEIATQSYTPPTAEVVQVEVSHYSKMAGCGTRNGGPSPEVVLNSVAGFVGNKGFVELDLINDTVTVHLETPGTVTLQDVMDAIRGIGAKPRPVGDRSAMPAVIADAIKRSGDKPVLVEMTSKSCLTCIKMKKTTFGDSRVKVALSKLEVVRVDVDERPKVPAYFNVSGTPLFLILDKKGKVTKRISGFRSPEEFVKELN